MRAWRLARRRHAALDGAGARLLGGRWNRRGQAAVYASEHLSLAILEVIVHLELGMEDFPADYVKIGIDVPDTVPIPSVKTLPATDAGMLNAGADWLASKASVGLLVPSVIVPEEFNLLLNPAHEDFSRIRPSPPQAFRFGRRLLGSP